MVIEMQGVTKRYGAVQALDGMDLAVGAGEVVALLGPNGAGKTTAISLMLGAAHPSGGSVRCFGGQPGSALARARVGVMLQDSGVPTSLRVAELIALFQSYYPHHLPLGELLERADLVPKRDALVSSLSGGQRQRLSFALAIAGDPDLVFLDEPTVGLDVSARRAFWRQVEGFAALGKTVLFSTHYLDEVDAVAQRVVVLRAGRVIAEGSPTEIKRLVADTTVRFRSDADAAWLSGLAEVERVTERDGVLVLMTNAPESLLARLFAAGVDLRELRVSDTDLDEAFVHLTNGAAGHGAAGHGAAGDGARTDAVQARATRAARRIEA